MKYLEYVKEVRNTVEKFEWIQDRLALTANNLDCDTSSGKVCKLCLLGAMYRVKESDKLTGLSNDIHPHFRDLIRQIEKATGETVPSWNDCEDRTKEGVLDLLDTIIKELQSNESVL